MAYFNTGAEVYVYECLVCVVELQPVSFCDEMFCTAQLEEDKQSVEEELKEKKSALALQLPSSGDHPHGKVCEHNSYYCYCQCNC